MLVLLGYSLKEPKTLCTNSANRVVFEYWDIPNQNITLLALFAY